MFELGHISLRCCSILNNSIVLFSHFFCLALLSIIASYNELLDACDKVDAMKMGVKEFKKEFKKMDINKIEVEGFFNLLLRFIYSIICILVIL